MNQDLRNRQKAELVLGQLGIPVSNVVNIFLKQVVMQREMPFDVKLSAIKPVALSDLIEIELNEELEKRIQSLAEMPERFRVFEKEPWLSKGLRQMTIDNYIVFYIPKAEDATVTIIRVMYGERNICYNNYYQ